MALETDSCYQDSFKPTEIIQLIHAASHFQGGMNASKTNSIHFKLENVYNIYGTDEEKTTTTATTTKNEEIQ